MHSVSVSFNPRILTRFILAHRLQRSSSFPASLAHDGFDSFRRPFNAPSRCWLLLSCFPPCIGVWMNYNPLFEPTNRQTASARVALYRARLGRLLGMWWRLSALRWVRADNWGIEKVVTLFGVAKEFSSHSFELLGILPGASTPDSLSVVHWSSIIIDRSLINMKSNQWTLYVLRYVQYEGSTYILFGSMSL